MANLFAPSCMGKAIDDAADPKTPTAVLSFASCSPHHPPSLPLSCLPSLLLLLQGMLPLTGYTQRIISVYAVFFALLGGPISYQTFSPTDQVDMRDGQHACSNGVPLVGASVALLCCVHFPCWSLCLSLC